MFFSLLLASGQEGSGNLMMSTLVSRIATVRAQVQEAQEVCRARPPGGPQNSAPPSGSGTASSTPRAAPVPPSRVAGASGSSGQSAQVQLFQSACDLNPEAQQNLLSAVGNACVSKRQLLADLNSELQTLAAQNDHFSI